MNGSTGWQDHPLDPVPKGPKIPQTIWEHLPDWRKKWREIWYVGIAGKHYVFRSPTRGECIEHDLAAMSSEAQAMDRFVQTCMLYPEEPGDDEPLSTLMALYRAIWDTSGFRDPQAFEEKLEEFEELARSPDQANILLLMDAFPGILPEKINSWQPEEIIYHIALARVKLGIEPPKRKRKRREPKAQEHPSTPPPRKSFDWESDRSEFEAFKRG